MGWHPPWRPQSSGIWQSKSTHLQNKSGRVSRRKHAPGIFERLFRFAGRYAMEDIWEKSWREEQGPRLVLRTGCGPEREAAVNVSHATDIAGKGLFSEAGPRRNYFPKANASEVPSLCILARSQRRAGRRQEPTQTQGGAECCKPRVLWGSSSAPQGSPGSHGTDSRDGCSPAPVPWQSRAQRDGMRQGYFSPSTQAPILQMTHFLHLLPITLQLVQTRCDRAVTRLLRRTAGTSSCQNKERVRGSKHEGWGRGGWEDGEDPAPTSSAPPPAPEGSDTREQPLGFTPLRLREPVRGSAGWGGGAPDQEPTPAGTAGTGRIAREMPSPELRGLADSSSPRLGRSANSHERPGSQSHVVCPSAAPAFVSHGNSEGKRHRAPHLPPAPRQLKARRGERLPAPCFRYSWRMVATGAVSRRNQEAQPAAPSSRPRAPGQERHPPRQQPGAASPAASFTASNLGAAPSGTLPKKIKGTTLKIK